jgi:hypothetical protein
MAGAVRAADQQRRDGKADETCSHLKPPVQNILNQVHPFFENPPAA